MTLDGRLPEGCKRLSVVRRVTATGSATWRATPGEEGCVGVFEVPSGAAPIMVEAESGRAMTLLPGDIFLASPGHRESVRWVVGRVPVGGLLPGSGYSILAESGVVGELLRDQPPNQGGLGPATYLGAALGPEGVALNIRDFRVRRRLGAEDVQAPVHVIVGTSVEVGKTTAGLTLLRTLRGQGYDEVVVLKATGTTSLAEADLYRDFGASHVFDCVDFGLPTTFPSGRDDARGIFAQALDVCLSISADAVLIECGGDLLGTCVPEFLQCLLPRRRRPTAILAAADTAGALGATQTLAAMGLTLDLITGRCTDTEISRQRVEAICGIPAKNMRL